MMRTNLRTARTHLATLRQALQSPSPEEIGRCVPSLVEAAGCLSRMEQQLRQEAADAELAAELKQLRNDLKIVARMIEHGAAFYRGWASLLGAAAAGYTPAGSAAEIQVTGTVSMRG